jgi:predicted ATP-grasp superfamily ATP-dependent carboligase
VILLGGGANALSVARSLGRAGVPVFALNHPKEHVCYSRFCTRLPVPPGGSTEESWEGFLLGRESEGLRGAVLLACCDEGLEILARNREALRRKFLLDLSHPPAQRAMLNKLATYQQAQAADVPTPRFWVAETAAEVEALRAELVYPLVIKPLFSHVYQKRFAHKFVVVHSFDELRQAFGHVSAAGIDVMLVEWIPGPDDRLCSYYTYLDEQGHALFDFTKRVIRRYPAGWGPGCYHITDWNPEARDLGLRLFQHVGLRGLANVEFKRDQRDGRLKLIEVNARFTAANCLVAASGYDLAPFVYQRIVGRPLPPLGSYQVGKRLWYPLEDYCAFRALRRQGKLSWRQWLASIAHPKMLPCFHWDDPLPSIVHELRRLKNRVLGPLGRMLRRVAAAR